MIEVMCCIIAFLLLFIVFQALLSYKERDALRQKLMAKSFVDYSNVELAKTDLSRKEPKGPAAIKF